MQNNTTNHHMIKLIDNTRRCDISFNSAGSITISARISRILRLRRGDVINVGYLSGEYYLMVEGRAEDLVGRRECRVHPSHWGSHMRANSVRLCRRMLAASGCQTQARLVCGDPVRIEGRVMIPIITKLNLNPATDE